MNKYGFSTLPAISLLLLILSLLELKCKGKEPPDLTLIVKNGNESNEFICVVEGNALNSGIGWIYSLVESSEDLPKTVSNYVPAINNDYSCNFAKGAACNDFWQMRNWQNSKFDSHSFKPTLDNRWEDFPTIITSNRSNEFVSRLQIPNPFEIGISVRAAKNAEIFLCEGWNPHFYPCYYINIGNVDNKQVSLRKYKNVPDNTQTNDTNLAKYKSEGGILSEFEWKNFRLFLSENGTLVLSEMYQNEVLLNYTDLKPYQPHYLFVRSKYNTAFWKIHKNHYLFTTKARVTQFGPTLEMPASNLCISLYVSMCKYCKFTFFIMDNGKKKILKQVFNRKEEESLLWTNVKLTRDSILEDTLKIFAETENVNNTLPGGFWAVDDVRICTKNEIRVLRLRKISRMKDVKKSHISCEALNYPTWRPTLYNYNSSHTAGEELQYSSQPTSIKLFWKTPSNSTNHGIDYRLVKYEGKDICRHDDIFVQLFKSRQRLKSNGYVINKSNSAFIKGLIPYTNYNITFYNIIDENAKYSMMDTSPTNAPTKEELPTNLTIQATEKTSVVEWNSPKCNETYGPVVYRITVNTQDGGSNQSITDIKTKYTIKNLKPFTNYIVEIIISRTIENLNNTNRSTKMIYNFTTSPGIAPKVENLELYATDTNSAHLRFDLSKQLRGEIKEVQVQWCHPLFVSGCKSDIQKLRKCSLWPDKFCVHIGKLVIGYDYKFAIAVKNHNTSSFGKQQFVVGTAVERVPGKPENISYKMINCRESHDYCDLNITWFHPYNQNATIKMFDIILNESTRGSGGDTLRSIYEIMQIDDKAYKPIYTYIVKYVPVTLPYTIFIRAANHKYKGNFISATIKIRDIENYADKAPELVGCTDKTLSFKLPQLNQMLNSSVLLVIVQDYDTNKTRIIDDIGNFFNKNDLCNEYGEMWIAKVMKLSNNITSSIITIGDGTNSYFDKLNKLITNKPLQRNKEYCLTFMLVNEKNPENFVIYHKKHQHTRPIYEISFPRKEIEGASTNTAIYLIPILFLVVLIVVGVWLTYRHLRRKRRKSAHEPVYETMPFNDYLLEAVSNQTYDRLIHD